MTEPKVIRNVYCTDPEDRVIEWRCAVCERCWLYVASKGGRRNNTCPFGGPFTGVEHASKPE
jgi:rubredoxin